MTIEAWIAWAVRPDKHRHHYHSFVLAQQAARDLQASVSHDDFCRAMEAAGYKVAQHWGKAVYFACQDTAAKRQYIRQRYVMANDNIEHPLGTNYETIPTIPR